MPEPRLARTKIDTGVRVLSERVPGVRSVSLGVWMDAGSREEADSEHGLAHMLEHMLFKGTPSLTARRIAEEFDYMGADINAVTGKEYTSLYTRILESNLPRAVEIMADMVQNPMLEPKEVESEKRVILEEIAMHLDSPDELAHEYLAKTMWGDHPLGRIVLGDPDTVEQADRKKIIEYHRREYVNERLVVAAAGCVDHESLCDLVGEQLDLGAGCNQCSRSDAMESPLAGNAVLSKETEQAHICMGAKGLPKNHPHRFALAVMDNILGGSMSSRLFQKIREELGLAYSIYSYSRMYMGMGMVGVYCGTHPGKTQRVIDLIGEELERVNKNGFGEPEIDRAKNHLRGIVYISMEDNDNRMSKMAKAELSEGEHLSSDEMAGRIESVTLEDLEDVFSATWGSGKISMAVVGPIEEGELSLPAID